MAPAKKEPKETTIECEILRDFWNAEGERFRAGSVIEVDVDVAMDGVEMGSLRRHK